MNTRELLFLMLLLWLYFLPALIAWHRRHASRTAILVLNLFLAWTFIGWWVALLWALAGYDSEPITTPARRLRRPVRW